MIYGSADRVSTPSQYPPQTRVTPIDRRVSESGIPVVFRFQAPLTGYRMDGYIMPLDSSCVYSEPQQTHRHPSYRSARGWTAKFQGAYACMCACAEKSR